MSTYYRIQDSRSPLPARSKNYYAEGSEDPKTLGGVSAFCNLHSALLDLLGGRSADNWGTVYSETIREAGGEAVLVVVDGRYIEDDAGDASVIAPDLATERRFTVAQLWAATYAALESLTSLSWSDWTDYSEILDELKSDKIYDHQLADKIEELLHAQD